MTHRWASPDLRRLAFHCFELRVNKAGDRLFVPVRLVDNTGSVQVRMRESAALELSGLTDKDAFIAAVRDADLSFPMFSSIRVFIRDKGGETLQPTGAAEPGDPEDTPFLSSYIVEAEEQSLETDCRPNKSFLELNPLHALLPPPASRFLIASLNHIHVSPHSGLVVGDRKAHCEFVITMIAATKKSIVKPFGDGHRVITADILAVDIEAMDKVNANPVPGSLAAMCTTANLGCFTLAPSRPGRNRYAIVMVSAVADAIATGSSADQKRLYVVEKVMPVNDDAVSDHLRMLQDMALLANGRIIVSPPCGDAGEI